MYTSYSIPALVSGKQTVELIIHLLAPLSLITFPLFISGKFVNKTTGYSIGDTPESVERNASGVGRCMFVIQV